MKILYVEDNPQDVDLTIRALKKTAPHFKVTIANTQKKALSILDGPDFFNFDLVLADMNLPDGDGIFIVSHIRLRSLPLGVVLLTGQGDEETAVSALKAGADDYVLKRAGYLDHLHTCLETALQHYRFETSKRKKPIKVLYVEHHDVDIDLTRRHFERHAPHIHLDTINHGSDLLNKISDQKALSGYNVLLLDYRLPGVNALDILKNIKLHLKLEIPVILITGKGDEELAVAVLKLGASDYVVKNSGYLFKLPSIIENTFHSSLLARQHIALKKSEEKYRNIFENAIEGLFQSTPQGRFISVNPAFAKMLGYASPKELTASIWDIAAQYYVNKEDRHRYQQLLQETGSVKFFEFKARCKDGSHIWVSDSTRAIYDQDGRITRYEGNVTDITQRKQAEKEKQLLEAQYRQAQKMESVGRLAGGVAHDYNNALGVIMGFTEMAMTDMDPAEPLYADLTEVLKAARRAADITRQLLAFARKQTISPKVLDLNENVESMLKMLRRLIGEDIDLAWLPGKSLWSVKIDPSQIDQILANVCVNARDAIDGVGKVTIETATQIFDAAYCAWHTEFIPGEFVLLGVSDNGCGMGKEVLDNIFEPFFTTKDVDKGTGLGLATVYGIVKQNKGFINVYSEPDKGTSIRIYLPRHKGQSITTHQKITKKIPQGNGETILLVEDDISILKLADKMIQGLGYTVLTADDPAKALTLAREYKDTIHLVITDVIMPGMNGRELSEQLKSLYPELTCIFMSGYTANAIAHHGVLDKGVSFIQKPFSKKDLAEIIRRALNKN